MRTLNKTLLIASVIGGLSIGTALSTPAMAETQIPAGAVKVETKTDVVTDKEFNPKGEVVVTETTTTITDIYEYDTNKDNFMDEDEYVTYSYTKIDHNGDGLVDEIEWNDYTNYWYSPLPMKHDPVVQKFVSYDLNGDGRLDRDEYEKAYDVKIYSAWDANQDGRVDRAEYETINRTYYDLDSDGIYEWHVVN